MVNILFNLLDKLAIGVFPNLTYVEHFGGFATANFTANAILQIQCFRFWNLTGMNADRMEFTLEIAVGVYKCVPQVENLATSCGGNFQPEQEAAFVSLLLCRQERPVNQ